MKKVLLIISIFISGFGFSQTITGIGNITDPSYGLVGLPGCGIEPGDTFTFSGSGFTIGNDNFSIIADGGGSDIIPFNISNFALGIYSFEVPNVTSVGSNFKLSGQIAVNETTLASSVNITVLSCPQNIQPKQTAELGETIKFIGNDLDLVSYVTLRNLSSNEVYTVTSTFVPYDPIIQPFPSFLTFQIPAIPSLVGFNLLPTFVSLGGFEVPFPSSEFFTITTPSPPPTLPPAPTIITVLGLNGAAGSQVTIIGNNFVGTSFGGTTINLGGVVINSNTLPPSSNPNAEIIVNMPTGGFSVPYITVNVSHQQLPQPPFILSATWYFSPQVTYNGGTQTVSGSSFDAFTMAGSGFGTIVPYNRSNFPPSLVLHENNYDNITRIESNTSIAKALLFNAPSTIVSQISNSAIKTIDLDGDGSVELVYANGSSLLGYNFNNQTTFLILDAGIGETINVFDFGDFNADGLLDYYIYTQGHLIYTSPISSRISLSLANADYIKISDINADGKADISYFDSNNPKYIINTSSNGTLSGLDFGSTSPISIDNFGSPPGENLGSTFADINNDGNIDFAGLSREQNGVHEFNYRFGGLNGQQQYVFSAGTATGFIDLPNDLDYQSLASADFNGDGYMDFIVNGTNTTGGSVFAYLTNTNGTGFNVAFQTFVGEAFTKFAVADFNADGSMDLAAINYNFLSSVSGVTFFKNNFPCGTISADITPQFAVTTIGGDNLFTLKYTGSAPNAISWSISVPGVIKSFEPLTSVLGAANITFTNAFEKTLNSNVAAGYNYYNSVYINAIPLSLSGAVLKAVFTDFCSFTSIRTYEINLQLPCPTVSAANFSFSGDQFPLSIGSSIAFFDVIEPNPYSIPTSYTFYVQKNKSISPIIIDNKDAKLDPSNRGINLSRLRLSASIFSTLDGANLFAVASYCGGNFTVLGLNTITVNSCLTDINIFPKNSSKPFCEFNAEEFESTDGAAIPTNWQISTSIAGVFTNFNTVTGLYTGTNKSILGITTLLSSLNGKSIRFTYNGNCLSEPYLLEIDTKPRFLSPLTNPEPVCGSRGLIEIVAEVPSNLRNPSYQWYKFNSSTAGVFVPITSFTAPYGSVTTGLLSLTNPDISLDQTQYQLQLSANCGSQNIVATSQPAMIRVLDGPPTGLSVIQNPAVCDGADVSKFFITALGADMQYVWEENNAGTWQVIAEDNVYKPQFDTLFVIDANRTNFTNRTYRVSITSACFTGTGASVTSNQDATYSFYDRPVITSTISGNCILGSSILSVTPNTSYNNYTWILANGKNTIISKSLEPNYSLILPNTYNVYVNNNKRCTAVQSFPFAYPALVRATITKESTIKENALVANEAVSYQWYAYGRHITGAINRKFIGNYNGKYTVKVKYANSCEDVSDTSFVNVAGYLDILRSEAIITDTSITFINKRNIEDDFIKIAIAPNPTNDVFKASFMAKRLTPKLISLLDVNGAVRLETEAEYKGLQQYAVEIDVKGLQPGIYFLRLIDEDQTRWAKVVVF